MQGKAPDVVVRALQLFRNACEHHARGAIAEADALYRQANALLPTHPQILIAWAQLAEDVKDWKSAGQLYRQLGKVSPTSGFEGKLAVALFNQQLYAEAMPFLEAHQPRQPDNPDLLWMLGFCRHATGDFAGALTPARKLYEREPAARGARLLVSVLADLGDRAGLDAVKDEFFARYASDPKVVGVLAQHLLKCGDLAGGFARVTAIRTCFDAEIAAYQQLSVPAWDGKRFDGTLLVSAEQGLGDEILASPLFVDLLASGQRCLIEADRRLLPLFRRSWPSLDFVPRNERHFDGLIAAGGEYRKTLALDLAVHFGIGRAAQLKREPWLAADTARRDALRAAYRQQWPGELLVGVSWKSRRVDAGKELKSLPLAALAPILATPGCRMLNLQYGDIAADVAAGAGELPAPWQDPDIDPTLDIDALAAQIAALDLVITTSNTTAHLAGALGANVWLLLPKTRPVLWYWGYEGERTPWYPSIRILRNGDERDWSLFLREVADRLAAYRAAGAPP